MNALVAKAQKTPEEGWTMQDGTSWPGNNTRDHPGMIQVLYQRLLTLYFLDSSSESLIFSCRFFLDIAVRVTLKETNFQDWYTYLERRDLDTSITRKLEQKTHW